MEGGNLTTAKIRQKLVNLAWMALDADQNIYDPQYLRRLIADIELAAVQIADAVLRSD